MLLDLQSDQVQQGELDWQDDHGKDRSRLMSSLDNLNQRFGRGTVQLASAGLQGERRVWTMKQERRTAAYTTCLADMPTVKARPHQERHMQATHSGMLTLDRHAQPTGLHLELELDGASEQDIARGIQAAQEVFRQANVSSYAAAMALAYQESESDDVYEMMTDEQFAWADVWRVAEAAAVQAACRDLPPGRKSFLFSQDWDDSGPKPSSADCIHGSIDWPRP